MRKNTYITQIIVLCIIGAGFMGLDAFLNPEPDITYNTYEEYYNNYYNQTFYNNETTESEGVYHWDYFVFIDPNPIPEVKNYFLILNLENKTEFNDYGVYMNYQSGIMVHFELFIEGIYDSILQEVNPSANTRWNGYGIGLPVRMIGLYTLNSSYSIRCCVYRGISSPNPFDLEIYIGYTIYN